MAAAGRNNGAPFNINTASRAQLLTLPGIAPAIVDAIVSERSMAFTDWDDVLARVKGIKKGVVAKIKRRHLAFLQPLPRFDPVQELPGDLTAICFSYVGVNSLLGAPQRVSRAWRDAIDGGLPAIWHEVRVNGGWMADARLADVARMSRERMRSLKLSSAATSINLQGLSQPSLRVLHVTFWEEADLNGSLSRFPQLEDVLVKWAREVVFPPLRHLNTVECSYCWIVKGIHNLPALTNLTLASCKHVRASEPWPNTIRDLTISTRCQFNHLLLDRIASLQHLTHLNTDFSFVKSSCRLHPAFFTPPHGQFAFLSSAPDLQRLTIELSNGAIPSHILPRTIFTDQCLGAISSVRELCLHGDAFTDADMQHVAQLPNLQVLEICEAYCITDAGIRLVSSLPHLTSLLMEQLPRVKSYAFVGRCSELRTLSITSLAAVDIQAIAQLQRLEELTLRCASQDSNDVCCLGAMRTLRHLSLSRNDPFPPSLFSALIPLRFLRSLSVSPIQSEKHIARQVVDCLVQMPQLRSVCVRSCKGRGLAPHDKCRLRHALPHLETLMA